MDKVSYIKYMRVYGLGCVYKVHGLGCVHKVHESIGMRLRIDVYESIGIRGFVYKVQESIGMRLRI